MKKILISNDDGILADGIIEIARLLSKKYEVVCVAPDEQKSGKGQSITFRQSLYCKEVKYAGLEHVSAFAVTGTPADCVKFAIGNLKVNPDIVVSGINLGANLGTDVWYSGTLGAATEAVLLGYPSIALSVISHEPDYLCDAAEYCAEAVDFYIENTDICRLLSVNVPNIPKSEIKGVKIATLSKRNYPLEYEKQPDGGYVMPKWKFCIDETNKDSDEYLVQMGYVTYTPVVTDRCEYDRLKPLAQSFEGWKK